MLTVAADLSESVNLEHGSLWGHYDPEENPQRHAAESGDSGSRQRVDRHRSGQSERVGRSGQVCRRVGVQRHLRRVHPVDVPAGARLEPAESGQPVPDGRAPHPGGTFGSRDRRRRANAFRHLLAAGVEALPARARHQPEFLGLQRRRAGVLRRGGDRGAREESRDHHDRGRAARFTGRRSQHVRGHRSEGGGQGTLRDSRFRTRPAEARLRRRAGIEGHVESGERVAASSNRPASTSR